MSVKEFAEFIGLGVNTISNVENAKEVLSRTPDAIDKKLSEESYLEWFPDDGKSIGVRLHYTKRKWVPAGPSPMVRYFDKRKPPKVFPPYDQSEFERGMINSKYPHEQWLEDQKKLESERLRLEYEQRDKRIGKRTAEAKKLSALKREKKLAVLKRKKKKS